MPGPADPGAVTWLVLAYRLPDRPPALKQLTARHAAIRERDTLGAGQAQAAASALAGHQAALDEYARHVYATTPPPDPCRLPAVPFPHHIRRE